LVERVERLMTIPAVGPITALTWALEVGDVQRFPSIKKAISYCQDRDRLCLRTIPSVARRKENNNSLGCAGAR